MKLKNNLDEMQEQKLLKIEHNVSWLAFWGLVAVIIIQTTFGNASFRDIAGELIVFSCIDIYLGFACIKNGIWDRHLKLNLKTNMAVSLIAAMACGIIFFVSSFYKYNNLIGSVITFAFIFIFVFVATLSILWIVSKIFVKRVQKLESETEEK